MRLSATRSLFERRDVIIVASVSCIYGLGSPEAYYGMLLPLERGQRITREEIILSGEVPSPINPPSGCRFHPRCPFVMRQCSEIEPTPKEIAANHMVACHLY